MHYMACKCTLVVLIWLVITICSVESRLITLYPKTGRELSIRENNNVLTIKGGCSNSHLERSERNNDISSNDLQSKSFSDKQNDENLDEIDDEIDLNEKQSRFSILSIGVDALSGLQTVTYKLGKASVKSVVDLFSNKHVKRNQITGKWKLIQEIEIRNGVYLSFPATIRFFNNGSLVTEFEGHQYVSKFNFVENSWPKKCRIDFEAKACILNGESEPINLIYKGYFKKSIFKPSVILMRGKIYKTTGSFWKKTVKIGRFQALPRRYI